MSRRPWWGSVEVALIAVATLSAASSSSCSSNSSSSNATTPTTAEASPTTATPAPPTTPASFDQTYGTFAPATGAGSGDGMMPVPTGAEAGLVTATHTGTGNFSIVGLDAQNAPTSDFAVDTVGNYNGITAFGLGTSRSPLVNLKVTASGPWTITLAPVSTAPTLASGATGKGDAVYQWTGKATTWTLSNTGGAGNFAVINHGSGAFGADLLVEVIGPYNASVPVKAGPAVTTIQSDGTWSITFS